MEVTVPAGTGGGGGGGGGILTGTAVVTAGPDAGGGAPSPIATNCTDSCGYIGWGTGSGTGANGRVLRVTFSEPRDVVPSVVVSPANTDTPPLDMYVGATDVDVNGFYIRSKSNPGNGASAGVYAVSYVCL